MQDAKPTWETPALRVLLPTSAAHQTKASLLPTELTILTKHYNS